MGRTICIWKNDHPGGELSAAEHPINPNAGTGGGIPPNAPFAAILDDQRSGNNIEAPEDLIRKIIREESGSGYIDM